MCPWTLRPPDRFSGSVRPFSGESLMMSATSDTVIRRRAALVGLYSWMPMACSSSARLDAVASGRPSLEALDRVTRLRGHDRLLEVGPLADAPAQPLALAASGVGANALGSELEERLHRAGHVVLGGLAVDDERVLPELLAGLVQLL